MIERQWWPVDYDLARGFLPIIDSPMSEDMGHPFVEAVVNVYSINRGVFGIALVGWAFCTYLWLLNAHIIDWKLFPKADEFNLDDPAVAGFLVTLWLMGTALVVFGRICVVTTDSAIGYRGILRTTIIRWCDVTRVKRRAHLGDMEIRAGRRRIVITHYIVNAAALKEEALQRAREHSPNVVIEPRKQQSISQQSQ